MVDQRHDNISYFDVERSDEVVNARMGSDIDPRLREVMTKLVRHAHAFVKEAGLTTEEWMAGIQFLTETGQMCNLWRQEFILLSDVLGVSMLVDSLDHDRPVGATENTVLGPFYVENPPHYPAGTNICLDGKGAPLLVRGKVVDSEGRPIAGATIDVWATNNDGFYDVQQPDIQPEFNLRGVFTSDAEGRFWFRTGKPRFYPIPDDGPVGKMLSALGRHPNRAAHLHFIVKSAGYEDVVTHIFPPDCHFLDEDAVFGVKKSLIADFRQIDDVVRAAELKFANPFWEVIWDFVLVPRTA